MIHNLHLKQMGVKTAFLNFPLVLKVWVRFPSPYLHLSRHTFVKLDISLHGLKQSAADRYAHQHARAMSFDPDRKRSVADLRFCYKIKDAFRFYLLVHVDDFACAYSDPEYFAASLQHFKGEPGTDFFLEVKLLEMLRTFCKYVLSDFMPGPGGKLHNWPLSTECMSASLHSPQWNLILLSRNRLTILWSVFHSGDGGVTTLDRQAYPRRDDAT